MSFRESFFLNVAYKIIESIGYFKEITKFIAYLFSALVIQVLGPICEYVRS